VNIHLIPQPQHLNVIEMPVGDDRLIRHAGTIFKKLEIKTGECGEYVLYAGINAPPYPELPMQREGYTLVTSSQSFMIRSRSAQGLFYGMQTLKQLLRGERFSSVEITDWPDLSLRSDYLDLRSIYPKFDRLLYFIQEMAEYKFNTLVIEYEDKLPFDTMPELCHPEAFSQRQLELLLETARENYIEVIPLQQSFGHLEYVLKHPQYERLRETPDTPGEMCPLREGAFELAAKLLREMANRHPNSRYLHIGCDEVWSLGASEECRLSGKSREQISVEYVNQLIDFVCGLGKIPIVWHDMFENASQEILDALDKRSVMAVWLYSDQQVRYFAPDFFERLHRAGISYLACSASRSYDHLPWQNYPCAHTRLRNIDSWCELAAKQHIAGIIHTNWASSFSLGRPYGLFETSRYTAFYGADRSWNLSGLSQTYLERFLSVYHGIHDARLYGGAYNRFDYYSIIPSLLNQVARNKMTAQLISVCIKYENAVPVICNAFRGALFPDSQVEYDCLRERSQKNYTHLKKLTNELEQISGQLLSPAMSTIFLASRTYQNDLYRKELEKILHIQL